MKSKDCNRDPTIIDASLNCLVGDGEKTKDVLFKIRSGAIGGGGIAKKELQKARYEDWLASKSSFSNDPE